MEIHAHAHTARKKWTHYLWEFLMLFLAVFCGFLAENVREHRVEHQREKRYMQNLLQDLARDTAHILSQQRFQQRAVTYSDSLVFILNLQDRSKYIPDLYYYSRILAILNPFSPSTATIIQLKSSGSLRLIKNESLVDSVVQYDVWSQRILTNDENIQSLIRDFRTSLGLIFDAGVINEMSNIRSITNNGSGSFVNRPGQTKPLITEDKKIINQFCTYADFLSALYQSQFNALETQKGRAICLISLINKEYHFQ